MDIEAQVDRIFERARRLQAPELDHLRQGYRRLARYGPARRSSERVAGLVAEVLAFGMSIPAGPRSAIEAAESRARAVIGLQRELRLLDGADEAVRGVAGGNGRRRSGELVRSIADAAIALEATGLGDDDRAMLAWPWRDAIEHRTTVPDPGSPVPRRTLAGLAVVTLALIGLAILDGSRAIDAILVYGFLAILIAVPITIFRALLWRPVLRVEPPAEDRLAAQAVGVALSGRAEGSRSPSTAPAPRSVGLSGVAILLGLLVIGLPWLVLVALPPPAEDDASAGRTLVLGLALATATPALAAGFLSDLRPGGDPTESFLSLCLGIAIAGVGSIAVVAAFDPGGEAWPWIVALYVVILLPIALIGFGVGLLLGRRVTKRRLGGRTS